MGNENESRKLIRQGVSGGRGERKKNVLRRGGKGRGNNRKGQSAIITSRRSTKEDAGSGGP